MTAGSSRSEDSRRDLGEAMVKLRYGVRLAGSQESHQSHGHMPPLYRQPISSLLEMSPQHKDMTMRRLLGTPLATGTGIPRLRPGWGYGSTRELEALEDVDTWMSPLRRHEVNCKRMPSIESPYLFLEN